MSVRGLIAELLSGRGRAAVQTSIPAARAPGGPAGAGIVGSGSRTPGPSVAAVQKSRPEGVTAVAPLAGALGDP